MVWAAIKYRCLNPSSKSYKDYGGRGIKILWQSYEEFRRDMGPTYVRGLFLERIDNNGHYCKDNCKWESRKQQAMNRRSTRWMTFGGERLTLTQCAERIGITHGALIDRLKKRSEQEALNPILFSCRCL
jgi:hypothetical protein